MKFVSVEINWQWKVTTYPFMIVAKPADAVETDFKR